MAVAKVFPGPMTVLELGWPSVCPQVEEGSSWQCRCTSTMAGGGGWSRPE
jgi:hypothetical protein